MDDNSSTQRKKPTTIEQGKTKVYLLKLLLSNWIKQKTSYQQMRFTIDGDIGGEKKGLDDSLDWHKNM